MAFQSLDVLIPKDSVRWERSERTKKHLYRLREAQYLYSIEHDPEVRLICEELLNDQSLSPFARMKTSVLLFKISNNWGEREHLRLSAKASFDVVRLNLHERSFIEVFEASVEELKGDLEFMAKEQAGDKRGHARAGPVAESRKEKEETGLEESKLNLKQGNHGRENR